MLNDSTEMYEVRWRTVFIAPVELTNQLSECFAMLADVTLQAIYCTGSSLQGVGSS